MGKKRAPITLVGEDVKSLREAQGLWRTNEDGKTLSAARLIGDSLRYRIDHQFHGNDIIRLMMMSLKEAAKLEQCNSDIIQFIDWYIVRMQDLMSGRISAARLYETIRRVERMMKREDTQTEQLSLDDILEGT